MRSEGDFIGESGLSVSRAEMNANPLQTTQIVLELKGWEWASRLWQEWNDTLPGATKAKDLPERTGKRLGDKETKDGAGFQ